jgi:hypothetical protein
MSTNNQRTMNYMRKQGFSCWVTENKVPYSFISRDLFNFIDVVAMKAGFGIVGIQTTSKANMSARKKKILAIPEHRIWLDSGGKIVIHGWYKKKGSRFWLLKEEVIT